MKKKKVARIWNGVFEHSVHWIPLMIKKRSLKNNYFVFRKPDTKKGTPLPTAFRTGASYLAVQTSRASLRACSASGSLQSPRGLDLPVVSATRGSRHICVQADRWEPCSPRRPPAISSLRGNTKREGVGGRRGGGRIPPATFAQTLTSRS